MLYTLFGSCSSLPLTPYREDVLGYAAGCLVSHNRDWTGTLGARQTAGLTRGLQGQAEPPHGWHLLQDARAPHSPTVGSWRITHLPSFLPREMEKISTEPGPLSGRLSSQPPEGTGRMKICSSNPKTHC